MYLFRKNFFSGFKACPVTPEPARLRQLTRVRRHQFGVADKIFFCEKLYLFGYNK